MSIKSNSPVDYYVNSCTDKNLRYLAHNPTFIDNQSRIESKNSHTHQDKHCHRVWTGQRNKKKLDWPPRKKLLYWLWTSICTTFAADPLNPLQKKQFPIKPSSSLSLLSLPFSSLAAESLLSQPVKEQNKTQVASNLPSNVHDFETYIWIIWRGIIFAYKMKIGISLSLIYLLSYSMLLLFPLFYSNCFLGNPCMLFFVFDYS